VLYALAHDWLALALSAGGRDPSALLAEILAGAGATDEGMRADGSTPPEEFRTRIEAMGGEVDIVG
jgi:hypothetical protein